MQTKNSNERVTQDEVVRQMGNSSNVFINHYRSVLPDGITAEDYWSITPSDFGSFNNRGFKLHEISDF